MATTTNHLGLTLPAGTEPVSLQVLNDNWRKVEAGILKALRGKAAHNLLDNSDFRNPVNQRGQTSWNSNGYIIDRWLIYSTNESFRVTSINASGLTTAGGGAVRQIVSSQITPKDASEYTYAVCKSDGTVEISNKWRDKNGNLVCPINGNGTYIWAALYEGSYTVDTLLEYVPKGYAAELAECQRYYYQSWGGTSKNLTGVIAVPAMTASRLQLVALPQTMRVTPTVTLYSITNGTADSVQEWVTDALVGGVTAVFTSKTRFGAASNGGFELGKYYYYHYAASADL